jgi:predicted  nucleic acid-binding Zn-ribbon protein
MSEEIKSRLDTFVSKMTKKIEKKELMPEIQQEYDELIEFLDKFSILKNEEFEALEDAMSKYDISMKKYEEQIKSYENQKKIDDEKIKNLKDELNKIINLEEQYKTLNNDYTILKKNYEKEKAENANNTQKIKNNEKLISELQGEITRLKNDNFTKDTKISELEKEQKKYESKILSNTEQINQIISEKSEISKQCTELNTKISEQKKNFEEKIKILEKQLKNLSDANSTFVQENSKVETQLKDFQILTNMAKVNTKKLKKEDFSILEVMSNRAESAEMEVQKLLKYVEQLKNLNNEIKNKIKPLEDYALLQIKHDHEISMGNVSIFDIQNKIFTDEERRELFKLKNEPNELIQTLIKIKTENLELHKHIKDITIECNQQLREARWKTK